MKSSYLFLALALASGGLLLGCEEAIISPSHGSGSQAGAYTILLFTHEGADHIAEATAHKARAAEATGWKDLFVVDAEKYSGLYWGHYKNRKSAMRNLKRAKAFVSPATKAHMYVRAMVVPLPGRDEGPKEWNLKNAPPDRKYSIQVGVYYDIPLRNYFGRKGEAVEVCRQLRQRGEEAYYFHGPVRSGVFVGSFPASSASVGKIQRRDPRTGRGSYVENFIVHDPRIKRVLRDYPELVICGNTETTTVYDRKTGRIRKVTKPSTVVVIPGRGEVK
jgi:hypothetical protein